MGIKKDTLGYIESRWSLATFLWATASTITGIMVTYLASITQWLNEYGPISWVFAGLFALVIMALFGAVIAWVRHKWIMATASRKWKERVDHFNPLDTEFNKKRLKIHDIADPMSGQIVDKRFIDCDLLGPANLLMYEGNEISGAGFINCDLVLIKDREFFHNITNVKNTKIFGGRVCNATIYMPDKMAEEFRNLDPNVNFIGYGKPKK